MAEGYDNCMTFVTLRTHMLQALFLFFFRHVRGWEEKKILRITNPAFDLNNSNKNAHLDGFFDSELKS